MSENIVQVTDETFEEQVLNAEGPVLVDFWAAWCGPCKMIAPILDELASQYEGTVKVCKMDVDSNQDIPARYGIRGIPTLMIFKDSNLESTKVGALSKSQLVEFVEAVRS